MWSVGDAYDNTMAESVFASLEGELLDRRIFRTQVEARMEAFRYIEGWCNLRRCHSALGYPTPVHFEAEHGARLPPTLAPLTQSPPPSPAEGPGLHSAPPQSSPLTPRVEGGHVITVPRFSPVHRNRGVPGRLRRGGQVLES